MSLEQPERYKSPDVFSPLKRKSDSLDVARQDLRKHGAEVNDAVVPFLEKKKKLGPIDVARQDLRGKHSTEVNDAVVPFVEKKKPGPIDIARQVVNHAKNLEDKIKNPQETSYDKKSLLQEKQISAEAPHHQAFLPDGEKVIVYGDPEKYAQFNHQQGDNFYGYKEDCGLVSCQDVLDQFGAGVSETDVVGFAIKHRLCESTRGDASASGGTTLEDQEKILQGYGVPAHAETGRTMQDLASHIEQNKGVIIEVNAGVLWNDSHYFDNGDPNHAIVVTGDARDIKTGDIRGFYINDSGANNSDKFIDVQTMRQAWEKPGGECVVTDIPHGTTLG